MATAVTSHYSSSVFGDNIHTKQLPLTESLHPIILNATKVNLLFNNEYKHRLWSEEQQKQVVVQTQAALLFWFQ